jgi:hypothetical protein
MTNKVSTWDGVVEDEAKYECHKHAGGEEDGDDLVNHGRARLNGSGPRPLHPLHTEKSLVR